MLHSPGPILADIGNLLSNSHLPSFSLPIRWYGLLTGLGFFAAVIYCQALIAKTATDQQKQNLLDLLFWCFLGGIVGARLWFCLLNFDYFSSSPLKILQIWEGGQSIQGGFVGGFLFGWLFYKLNLTSPNQENNKQEFLGFWAVSDLVALVLPVGQAIGRWGNFFNIEAFGKPTSLPWALFVPPELRPDKYLGNTGFHPTFLYESAFLIIVAFILYKLYKVQKFQTGSLIWIYFILYSMGRFFIEFLRTDSLLIGPFAAAQVICSVTILISSICLWKRENGKRNLT